MVSMRLLCVALMAVLATTTMVQAEEKECEVCVKVVNDVKGTFAKLAESKGSKKLDVAELAVEKYCGKKLASKDQKLCYFLEPLKKDVARQVQFGKDSLKICKSLEKKNPDFCTMRYPVKTDANTDYSKMRVKQLKKILNERGVKCVGCVEKVDFINKIKETEDLHTEL